MAIAVLVSCPAEADRFAAIGLDLAARLSTSVIFLCIKPAEEGKKSANGDKKKPDGESSPGKTEKNPASKLFNEFEVSANYVTKVRDCIVKHLGTLAYGFVSNDVFEVSGKVDDIRQWVTDQHESPNLGHFDLETLYIPMLRGAGLEHSREQKERLFESSQIETVYLSVCQSQTKRLELNNIGVGGNGEIDLLNASRFARRLSGVRVTKLNEDEREQGQNCVVIGIHGKAGQTRMDSYPRWKSLRKDGTLPIAMLLNPADSVIEKFRSAIDDKMQGWFEDYQLPREDRRRLSDKLEAGAASSPEFILFMAVATFLACIGLIQDSAAVIIGAMLVAPLMTPLLGAGLAMIFGNKPLFVKAVKSILLGVTIAFLIGTVVGLFSLALPASLMSGTGFLLTNEMISRSQPNLLDPFIGLAAGLAGGFAIGRDGQIGTVAGVAIAAALVPPIATAGLETALSLHCAWLEGDPLTFFRLLRRDPSGILESNQLLASDKPMDHVHLISAPLVLFALNACATIIGAFIGLRMVGMHRTSRARQSRTWVVAFMVGLLIAILILMVLPLLI